MTYGERIAEIAKDNSIQFHRFLLSLAGLLVHHAGVVLRQPFPEVTVGKDIWQESDDGILNPTDEDVVRVLFGFQCHQWLRHDQVRIHLMEFLEWLYDCPIADNADLWDLMYPENMANMWNRFALNGKQKGEPNDTD